MAGFVTEALEERDITLYHHILFAIFGLAPWNVTSALFAQLPLVLPLSPQMAQLPSYMDVATNLGNGPMLLYLFFVGRSAFAKRQPQSLNAATVYALFALALLTAAGFAGLWDETVNNFSIYVVFFALCGGIVGDVMMVTAFPWLTQFHPCAPFLPRASSACCSGSAAPQRLLTHAAVLRGRGRHYTSSFATGLSGHGLLTNGLAVIQDVGGPNPRFGVGGFMLLVAAVQLAALAAFDRLRRQRSSVAVSEAQHGKGWGRKDRIRSTGDELLDGEKQGLTDGEEGREADDELDGELLRPAKGASTAGLSKCHTANTFKFTPLLASQAWTNYVYFLIPALIPYITRLPELRGLGVDPRTHEADGSDGLDGELYMWLNFITTAACGVGSLITIWVELPHPGRLNLLMTCCFATMFGAAVTNVYSDVPAPGSFMSLVQSRDTQLLMCFVTSLLNGYIKTFIYSHVGDIQLSPSGPQSDDDYVARQRQFFSRRLSTASQLAALSASVSMFILGPISGFFPQ